jgi:hypothetical protein
MNPPISIPKSFRKKRRTLILPVVLCISIIGIIFYTWNQKYKTPLYGSSDPRSLLYCYHDTGTGTVTDPDCIKKTAGIVLDTTSTRDFMDFLTSSGTPEVISNNCHAIAHVIGAQTFDRSTSMESALSKCNNSCGV